MKALQFGEITVERCIESEGPSFSRGSSFQITIRTPSRTNATIGSSRILSTRKVVGC